MSGKKHALTTRQLAEMGIWIKRMDRHADHPWDTMALGTLNSVGLPCKTYDEAVQEVVDNLASLDDSSTKSYVEAYRARRKGDKA